MGECLACTPVAHPRTEPPDLYLILHRGDHRCAARSPAGGLVLRLTPLRSATVPRIAIIIITTAGDGDPGQRQHHRSAGRWPRTPLFPALLLLTALRGTQRQHQPRRHDHPVTLTLARNRNPEQADMRHDTVAVLLACQTSRIGRRCPANVDGSVSVSSAIINARWRLAGPCRLGSRPGLARMTHRGEFNTVLPR